MSTPIGDSEIKAMARIAKTLEDLDDETRRRVLSWVVDKFLGIVDLVPHGDDAGAFALGTAQRLGGARPLRTVVEALGEEETNQ